MGQRIYRTCSTIVLTICLIFTLAAKAAARTTGDLASWYGKQHQGKKMANGKRFDLRRFTAAHRKYKLGTLLNVCFIKTGKCTEVEVTDRGPFKKKRSIDLSEAAARKIGLRPFGTGKVTITKVEN